MSTSGFERDSEPSSPSSSPYTPIACALYDELERLVIRREEVRIVFRDLGQEHSRTDTIADVYSRDKQEFIKLKSGMEIRLDRLSSVGDIRFSGDHC
ncbi:MAG: hypothetical protein JJU35_08825 [Balneolales bacterium]|nr:hypothetical protein [Balneolales bacterium]